MNDQIEFKPPINQRDDLELIAIAHSATNEWQQSAIDQAKSELTRRGITLDQQSRIIKEWEEAEKSEELKYQEQLKINATEKYGIGEMLYVLLLSPLILTGKIHSSTKLTLTELYRENFKIKFKQRIILLVLGVGLWIGSFYCFGWIITKITTIQSEKADISTWEENRINQKALYNKIKHEMLTRTI